jgi:hypothetical protein
MDRVCARCVVVGLVSFQLSVGGPHLHGLNLRRQQEQKKPSLWVDFFAFPFFGDLFFFFKYSDKHIT